jgi:hypothetical protein
MTAGQGSVSVKPSSESGETQLVGTPSQIEWALQIRLSVGVEFARVEEALRRAARKQGEQDRTATQAMIAILEEKCAEVLKNNQAGYFIRHWGELTDQVRLLLRDDARYQAIKVAKAERI